MNNEIIIFYRRALDIVCQVTGQADILRTNREDAVDARAILIYILSERGITDTQIAGLTSLTRQGVNKLKNSVRYRRKKWAFNSDLQQISNTLATESL